MKSFVLFCLLTRTFMVYCKLFSYLNQNDDDEPRSEQFIKIEPDDEIPRAPINPWTIHRLNQDSSSQTTGQSTPDIIDDDNDDHDNDSQNEKLLCIWRESGVLGKNANSETPVIRRLADRFGANWAQVLANGISDDEWRKMFPKKWSDAKSGVDEMEMDDEQDDHESQSIAPNDQDETEEITEEIENGQVTLAKHSTRAPSLFRTSPVLKSNSYLKTTRNAVLTSETSPVNNGPNPVHKINQILDKARKLNPTLNPDVTASSTDIKKIRDKFNRVFIEAMQSNLKSTAPPEPVMTSTSRTVPSLLVSKASYPEDPMSRIANNMVELDKFYQSNQTSNNVIVDNGSKGKWSEAEKKRMNSDIGRLRNDSKVDQLKSFMTTLSEEEFESQFENETMPSIEPEQNQLVDLIEDQIKPLDLKGMFNNEFGNSPLSIWQQEQPLGTAQDVARQLETGQLAPGLPHNGLSTESGIPSLPGMSSLPESSHGLPGEEDYEFDDNDTTVTKLESTTLLHDFDLDFDEQDEITFPFTAHTMPPISQLINRLRTFSPSSTTNLPDHTPDDDDDDEFEDKAAIGRTALLTVPGDFRTEEPLDEDTIHKSTVPAHLGTSDDHDDFDEEQHVDLTRTSTFTPSHKSNLNIIPYIPRIAGQNPVKGYQLPITNAPSSTDPIEYDDDDMLNKLEISTEHNMLGHVHTQEPFDDDTINHESTDSVSSLSTHDMDDFDEEPHGLNKATTVEPFNNFLHMVNKLHQTSTNEQVGRLPVKNYQSPFTSARIATSSSNPTEPDDLDMPLKHGETTLNPEFGLSQEHATDNHKTNLDDIDSHPRPIESHELSTDINTEIEYEDLTTAPYATNEHGDTTIDSLIQETTESVLDMDDNDLEHLLKDDLYQINRFTSTEQGELQIPDPNIKRPGLLTRDKSTTIQSKIPKTIDRIASKNQDDITPRLSVLDKNRPNQKQPNIHDNSINTNTQASKITTQIPNIKMNDLFKAKTVQAQSNTATTTPMPQHSPSQPLGLNLHGRGSTVLNPLNTEHGVLDSDDMFEEADEPDFQQPSNLSQPTNSTEQDNNFTVQPSNPKIGLPRINYMTNSKTNTTDEQGGDKDKLNNKQGVLQALMNAIAGQIPSNNSHVVEIVSSDGSDTKRKPSDSRSVADRLRQIADKLDPKPRTIGPVVNRDGIRRVRVYDFRVYDIDMKDLAK